MYVCVCVCVCVCVYIYIYNTYIYIRIQIYTFYRYVYIYIFIYAYIIHTYTYPRRPNRATCKTVLPQSKQNDLRTPTLSLCVTTSCMLTHIYYIYYAHTYII